MADIAESDVVIIQPWFTAVGHPAQSLLNTARALRGASGLRYLVSTTAGRSDPQLEAMQQMAETSCFKVRSPSLREGTLKALFKLSAEARAGRRASHLFFFDAHLALLAALGRVIAFHLKPDRLSLIYLMGPERVKRSRAASWLVERFLRRPEVVLYVRTEELAAVWHDAFPGVPASHIRYLPSLELPENEGDIEAPVFRQRLRFGVIGQVRHGKGLDRLVPMFQGEPALGELTVAGTFNNPQDARSLAFLQGFEGFRNAYLSDEAMLALAREQHYLLMLYDDWDARMESAVLYLAARAGRPVVAYDNGWCGRKVRAFGNGLLVDHGQSLKDVISGLPVPGSAAYADLLKGVERFREGHSVARLKEQYLQELMS